MVTPESEDGEGRERNAKLGLAEEEKPHTEEYVPRVKTNYRGAIPGP